MTVERGLRRVAGMFVGAGAARVAFHSPCFRIHGRVTDGPGSPEAGPQMLPCRFVRTRAVPV